MIVPLPASSPTAALMAFESLMEKLSFGSYSASPLTATVIVFDVSPGRNRSVPLCEA